jgi:Uma2 family endonuclease
VILKEPELHIDGQIVVPDLAGWRRERMPVMPDAAFSDLAPDWACEVISPLTGRLDRVKKLPHYARWGVSHLWFVDPLQRTLEIYRLAQGESGQVPSWSVVGTYAYDAKVRAEPFDAIELDLAILWAR